MWETISKNFDFIISTLKSQKLNAYKYIDLLSELCFYEELNLIKTKHAFKKYAMSYKIELVVKKDPLIQSEANKWSIKDLFNDLIDEMEGFNYQIILKVEFKNTSQIEKLNLLQLIST